MNTRTLISSSRAVRWTGAMVGLVALAGTACGTNNNSSSKTASSASPKSSVQCASGTVSGAGSTFVQTIVQQWIKDYAAACPGATVNYQGVGSGAGIQQFTAGTVDFAGSDVAMTATEQAAAQAKQGTILHIPWSSGGIAIEYNVKNISNLNLSPDVLAGIFAGKIVKWDDPAIKADNSGVTLPAEGIQVVHRSDGSGTTAAFTSYLTAAAGSVWKAGAAKDVPWPTGQGAKGSDGVTAAVKQTEGAIGYAELSFAKANTLAVAKIKNTGGSFVAPDGTSVAAALSSATVPADLKVQINYSPTDPAAYPISTTTFVIVPQKPSDPAKAKLLKAFILYALGPGQQSADGLYYAPLPSSLATQSTAVANSIAS